MRKEDLLTARRWKAVRAAVRQLEFSEAATVVRRGDAAVAVVIPSTHPQFSEAMRLAGAGSLVDESVRRWVSDECLVISGNARRRLSVATEALFGCYLAWCKAEAVSAVDVESFKAALLELGFQAVQGDGRGFRGLALKAELLPEVVLEVVEDGN